MEPLNSVALKLLNCADSEVSNRHEAFRMNWDLPATNLVCQPRRLSREVVSLPGREPCLAYTCKSKWKTVRVVDQSTVHHSSSVPAQFILQAVSFWRLHAGSESFSLARGEMSHTKFFLSWLQLVRAMTR